MSSSDKMKPTIWTRNFILLSLSNAMLFAGFNLLMPTLPLYTAAYGATPAQIGLIIGSFTFSAISIRLVVPAGIARWGRVHFFRAGLLLCILSMAGYYFTAQAATTLLVRLTHGLGFGIASTLYAVLVVELIPAARRGEGLGYFGLGSTFMVALAPLTGLWLYELSGAEGLFSVAAALQALALICLQFIAFSDRPSPPACDRPSPPFSVRTILFPCLLSLLLGICLGGVMSFITLLAREYRLGNPGIFFLTSTSCIFFVRIFGGRIYDRLGAPWVIAPAALSLVMAMVLLFTGKSELFLVAAACYGSAFGAMFPALQTWSLELAPREKHATASATFYNALDIGVGGGSILLGCVAEGRSYSAVYLVASGISLLLLVSYLAYLWRQRPR